MSEWIGRLFQLCAHWPAYLLLKLFVGYEVSGQENLKDMEGGPIIFASNHASYLDGPICAASMPSHKFLPIRFLVKAKFFKWKYVVAPFFVRLSGSIRVLKAGGNLIAALSETIIALENNTKIWIFPEGKLTPDGKIHEGKRGIAFLHQITGSPIVPVGVIGNFNIASEKYIFKRGAKIKIKIGKPIYSFDDMTLEEIVSKVMKEITNLVQEN